MRALEEATIAECQLRQGCPGMHQHSSSTDLDVNMPKQRTCVHKIQYHDQHKSGVLIRARTLIL